jgi:23S rRNA pseudouridine1911/1915/1917 synthase
VADPNARLQADAEISLLLPPPEDATPAAEPMPLDILFEDDDLIVIDKPAGLVVHPGAGNRSGTLVNALIAHCGEGLSGIGGVKRPGIVHRLDKDTSGLIVAAKTERAHNSLTRQLAERRMHKTYLALVDGSLQPDEAMIDAPIGRDTHNRKRMRVNGAAAREAQTSYRVRERFEGYTYLEATLITGRTHQIRVHLASLGHPVTGDAVYGHRTPLVARQFLHAWRLSLNHPVDDRELSFEAPLAEDLAAALRRLKGLS